MKTHRKVPKKCHFSPFGLNCGSETAFQARISGPHLRPASQAIPTLTKKRRDKARRELEEEEEHGGEEGQGSDQSFASDDGLLLTWEEDDLE